MIIKRIQSTEKNVSNTLLAETMHLADATKLSAENSQNQSAAVKEIVATMHDSTELANNIGEKIKEVTQLASKSRDAVYSGNEALQQNLRELLDIKNTNMLTIEGIKQLNTKINGIWDIVTIINNVADQTKIIAFNAELEASSSGEAGKNFHIVATEIRRLSDNIIDSSKEIREIISEIQKASDTLILDSEKGTAQIDSGCQSARSLENGFKSILQSSTDTASSSNEILDNVNQLTTASEQIFITLQQIAQGIESFSQSTTNISAASESVKEIASLL
jgi:methyl-accepting chemotaxis protein